MSPEEEQQTRSLMLGHRAQIANEDESFLQSLGELEGHAERRSPFRHGHWLRRRIINACSSILSRSSGINKISRPQVVASLYLTTITILAFTLFLVPGLLHPRNSPAFPAESCSITERDFIKPEGFKIVAVVFFGRRRTVEILDCYLRNNLASNGGFLDEVRFALNTENDDDIAWISQLSSQVEGYSTVDIDMGNVVVGWLPVWKSSIKRDEMIIKIDDDLVSARN